MLEANIQTISEKNIVKRKEAKVPEKPRSKLQGTGSVWLIMERVQANDSPATTLGSASPRQPLQLQRLGKGWAQRHTLCSALL